MEDGSVDYPVSAWLCLNHTVSFRKISFFFLNISSPLCNRAKTKDPKRCVEVNLRAMRDSQRKEEGWKDSTLNVLDPFPPLGVPRTAFPVIAISHTDAAF